MREASLSYHLLLYETVENFVERRTPYRSEHVANVQAQRDAGNLILAGAFDPADGAALLFRGDEPADAERFAREDPYVREGLVISWRVRRWNVVIDECRGVGSGSDA